MTDNNIKPWELTRHRLALIGFVISTTATAILLTIYLYQQGNPPARGRAMLGPGGIVGYIVYRAIKATENRNEQPEQID
jgi:hypothetical protein